MDVWLNLSSYFKLTKNTYAEGAFLRWLHYDDSTCCKEVAGIISSHANLKSPERSSWSYQSGVPQQLEKREGGFIKSQGSGCGNEGEEFDNLPYRAW